MIYTCPTHTFIYLFFSFTFFLIHPFLPPFPSNIFSFPPLTILSLLQVLFLTPIQFFFFTQKTRRKKYITHKKMREEEAATTKEESCSRRRCLQQQWVYVGIEVESHSRKRSLQQFFFYMMVFFIFFLEILVKLGFQNKNKDSLGIMLKMTNGNISNLLAFLTKQLQGLFSKRDNLSYLEKLLFDNARWQ